MDEHIEENRRFNYCEGIDKFIRYWDEDFDGEYAMVAVRNEASGRGSSLCQGAQRMLCTRLPFKGNHVELSRQFHHPFSQEPWRTPSS